MALSACPSGVWSRSASRLMSIDVQRQVRKDPAHHFVVAMRADVLEQIEERRRGGGLIAVHLGPEQHAVWPAADTHVIDRPSLERFARLFHLEELR
jgi:hypothetical protein